MNVTVENIQVEKKLFRIITNDAVKTAEAAGLVYVMSGDPGFARARRGKGFVYMDGRKLLTDEKQLERIRKLVIPPAWEHVWICKRPNGHLQATGFDKLGRKQYRYHALWTKIRNQTKFYRLREFGESLPSIRKNLEKDLSLQGYPQNKVLAAMVGLLERINIRVGNSVYEKLYGSFGLTTLKDHHVEINGSQLKIMFRGKKGVHQAITLSNRRLARVIQGCKDLPGEELFAYYDENGEIKTVDSGMVNDYIREISGSDFTAKDFRTWAGTINAILALKEIGDYTTVAEMNRKIATAVDMVAKQLGNTRAVCKKYYIHPLILGLYEEKKLGNYLKDLDKVEAGKDPDGYAAEERLLLRILRSPKL